MNVLIKIIRFRLTEENNGLVSSVTKTSVVYRV